MAPIYLWPLSTPLERSLEEERVQRKKMETPTLTMRVHDLRVTGSPHRASQVKPKVRSYWYSDEPAASSAMLLNAAAGGSSAAGHKVLRTFVPGTASTDFPPAGALSVNAKHVSVIGSSWEDVAAILGLVPAVAEDGGSSGEAPHAALPPPLALDDVRAATIVSCGLTARHALLLPILPRLRVLDLSDNPLTQLGEGGGSDAHFWLALAPALEELVLRGCQLAAIPPLLGARRLQRLDVSCNNIRAVDNLEPCCRTLRSLDVSFNDLGTPLALRPLCLLAELRTLRLHPNPVTLLAPGPAAGVYAALRSMLPQVTSLDGKAAPAGAAAGAGAARLRAGAAGSAGSSSPLGRSSAGGQVGGTEVGGGRRVPCVVAPPVAPLPAADGSPRHGGSDGGAEAAAAATEGAYHSATGPMPAASTSSASRTAAAQQERAAQLAVPRPALLPEGSEEEAWAAEAAASIAALEWNGSAARRRPSAVTGRRLIAASPQRLAGYTPRREIAAVALASARSQPYEAALAAGAAAAAAAAAGSGHAFGAAHGPDGGWPGAGDGRGAAGARPGVWYHHQPPQAPAQHYQSYPSPLAAAGGGFEIHPERLQPAQTLQEQQAPTAGAGYRTGQAPAQWGTALFAAAATSEAAVGGDDAATARSECSGSERVRYRNSERRGTFVPRSSWMGQLPLAWTTGAPGAGGAALLRASASGAADRPGSGRRITSAAVGAGVAATASSGQPPSWRQRAADLAARDDRHLGDGQSSGQSNGQSRGRPARSGGVESTRGPALGADGGIAAVGAQAADWTGDAEGGSETPEGASLHVRGHSHSSQRGESAAFVHGAQQPARSPAPQVSSLDQQQQWQSDASLGAYPAAAMSRRSAPREQGDAGAANYGAAQVMASSEVAVRRDVFSADSPSRPLLDRAGSYAGAHTNVGAVAGGPHPGDAYDYAADEADGGVDEEEQYEEEAWPSAVKLSAPGNGSRAGAHSTADAGRMFYQSDPHHSVHGASGFQHEESERQIWGPPQQRSEHDQSLANGFASSSYHRHALNRQQQGPADGAAAASTPQHANNIRRSSQFSTHTAAALQPQTPTAPEPRLIADFDGVGRGVDEAGTPSHEVEGALTGAQARPQRASAEAGAVPQPAEAWRARVNTVEERAGSAVQRAHPAFRRFSPAAAGVQRPSSAMPVAGAGSTPQRPRAGYGTLQALHQTPAESSQYTLGVPSTPQGAARTPAAADTVPSSSGSSSYPIEAGSNAASTRNGVLVGSGSSGYLGTWLRTGRPTAPLPEGERRHKEEAATASSAAVAPPTPPAPRTALAPPSPTAAAPPPQVSTPVAVPPVAATPSGRPLQRVLAADRWSDRTATLHLPGSPLRPQPGTAAAASTAVPEARETALALARRAATGAVSSAPSPAASPAAAPEQVAEAWLQLTRMRTLTLASAYGRLLALAEGAAVAVAAADSAGTVAPDHAEATAADGSTAPPHGLEAGLTRRQLLRLSVRSVLQHLASVQLLPGDGPAASYAACGGFGGLMLQLPPEKRRLAFEAGAGEAALASAGAGSEAWLQEGDAYLARLCSGEGGRPLNVISAEMGGAAEALPAKVLLEVLAAEQEAAAAAAALQVTVAALACLAAEPTGSDAGPVAGAEHTDVHCAGGDEFASAAGPQDARRPAAHVRVHQLLQSLRDAAAASPLRALAGGVIGAADGW